MSWLSLFQLTQFGSQNIIKGKFSIIKGKFSMSSRGEFSTSSWLSLLQLTLFGWRKPGLGMPV